RHTGPAPDSQARLEDVVRAAQRLYPSGVGRNAASADARRVPVGVEPQEGKTFSAFCRRHTRTESALQPATDRVCLHALGGEGLGPRGRRSTPTAQLTLPDSGGVT